MGRDSAWNYLTVSAPHQHARPFKPRRLFSVAELKRKLRESLVTVDCAALDEQANVLGLSRSTAWTILNGSHKSYGLSATTVNRMLVAPRLPPLTRTIILEYVENP